MTTIGKIDSLWRYPVKSMRGEELDEAFLGFSGIYGDRLFAFTSPTSPTVDVSRCGATEGAPIFPLQIGLVQASGELQSGRAKGDITDIGSLGEGR